MPRLLTTLLLMLLFPLAGVDYAQADIDLSPAVVIGNGPQKVIEFTDPDCPFCRKASAYFNNRRDVTRYVFFVPLPMHPHARQRAGYILSGNDKAHRYHVVMGGGVDQRNSATLPVTQAGRALLAKQQAVAKKAGVNATPTFMIMGRIIEGFDLPKIEELLGR